MNMPKLTRSQNNRRATCILRLASTDVFTSVGRDAMRAIGWRLEQASPSHPRGFSWVVTHNEVEFYGVNPVHADGLAAALAQAALVPGAVQHFDHERRSKPMPEPKVTFTKNPTSGTYVTSTTADSPEEFLREVSAEIWAVIGKSQEQEAIAALLPQVCSIWARLRGYKADGVIERRVLIAGEPESDFQIRRLTPASLYDADASESVASA